MCAAAVANAHLDYSTFKDEPLAAHFKELHRKLLEKKVPVGRIVRTFPRFLERRALVSEFAGWIEEELLKDEEVPKEASISDAQEKDLDV